MKQKYYLYRFIDNKEGISYIGRTNDIRRRIIFEHFTNKGHLPSECYINVKRVEYIELFSEAKQVAYEAILINTVRPQYNIQFNDKENIDIELPDFEWKVFEWDFKEQMKILQQMKVDCPSISNALEKVLSNLLEEEKTEPIVFGFSHLDEITMISPGSTMLIAGINTIYKSSYALQIAINNAKNGKKVLYINLKNSSETLIKYVLSFEAAVSLHKIQNNILTDEEWQRLSLAFKNISKLPLSFYNISNCGTKLKDIEKHIRKAFYDMVIIDDLCSIDDFENAYETDKYISAMKSIKEIALETQSAIISIYAINSKEMRNNEIKRPSLSNLAQGSLESYSDIIQIMHQDYNALNSNCMEFTIAKNYLGITSTVQLAVNNGRFVTLEKKS